MIKLQSITKNSQGWLDIVIEGPDGTLLIHDIVWVTEERQDLITLFYTEAIAVLKGAYHCCFSIPGKVLRIE